MKHLLIYKPLLVAAIVCAIISCKKTSTEPAFTATLNGTTYLFDSVFAWIDTSSTSLNHNFVNVGAKDTKGNNFIYLEGDAYADKNIVGTYLFMDSQPNPLPDNFKSLNGFSLILNTGQSKGIFHLGGSNTSNLSISKLTGSDIQGNLSIVVNPTFTNGATDTSQSLQMTGKFDMSYHFIP